MIATVSVCYSQFYLKELSAHRTIRAFAKTLKVHALSALILTPIFRISEWCEKRILGDFLTFFKDLLLELKMHMKLRIFQ